MALRHQGVLEAIAEESGDALAGRRWKSVSASNCILIFGPNLPIFMSRMTLLQPCVQPLRTWKGGLERGVRRRLMQCQDPEALKKLFEKLQNDFRDHPKSRG